MKPILLSMLIKTKPGLGSQMTDQVESRVITRHCLVTDQESGKVQAGKVSQKQRKQY